MTNLSERYFPHYSQSARAFSFHRHVHGALELMIPAAELQKA